jgi:hypothetical protein
MGPRVLRCVATAQHVSMYELYLEFAALVLTRMCGALLSA